MSMILNLAQRATAQVLNANNWAKSAPYLGRVWTPVCGLAYDVSSRVAVLALPYLRSSYAWGNQHRIISGVGVVVLLATLLTQISGRSTNEPIP